MSVYYLLYATTIFTSSFLLFLIQPLIGKHILPWYGGSSAVWITAMFFFMTALALGYIYALLLAKLKILLQVLIHSAFTVLTIFVLLDHQSMWPSGITPNLSDLTFLFTDPTLAVLETLVVIIGLPFVLLSSTSTLLQVWYNQVSGEEPFSLYAVSNTGSLLGLLSYPFVFEPLLSTTTQGQLWVFGVGVYAALLSITVYILLNSKAVASQATKALNIFNKTRASQLFVWGALAGVPVIVMLASTSFMTTAIAPVPFLWVGPLALYLLSFVVSFRDGFKFPTWLNLVFASVGATLGITITVMGTTPVYLTICVMHLSVFAVYHLCHDLLYARRPDASKLAQFYVAISLGGITASLVYHFSSLYILSIPIELLLILTIIILIASYRWWNKGEEWLPGISLKQSKWMAGAMTLMVLTLFLFYLDKNYWGAIEVERNFFGYKVVFDKGEDENTIRILGHGLTNHGYQFLSEEREFEKTAYYPPTSAIGKALEFKQSSSPEGMSVAIAGLGAGALLAYCREEDDYYLAEIDAQVVQMAKEHFTYLDNCPQLELEVKDARLAFAEQLRRGEELYDVIILDAYADDLMPMHLMTTEATGIYAELLESDGILAFNISSRYLDMLPVMAGNALANDLSALHFRDNNPSDGATISVWVLMAKSPDIFENEIFVSLSDFSDIEPLYWSDTHSALWPIVQWW